MAKADHAAAITRALNPILDWATNRLYVNRSEGLYWQGLRPTAAARVLQALHDEGFTITPMGARVKPSVTATAETPFAVTYRVDLPIESCTLWATHRVDARMAEEPGNGEYLSRRLARALMGEIEEQLAHQIFHQLQGLKIEPGEQEVAK